MRPPELILPPYMTAVEVADLIRTSPKAVYTMIERHQLPGVTRVGRRVLVRSQVLLNWLRDHDSMPSSEENRR